MMVRMYEPEVEHICIENQIEIVEKSEVLESKKWIHMIE
jgi:hypothetical protein